MYLPCRRPSTSTKRSGGLRALPAKERNAILHAVEKLEAVGHRLGYPHASAVHSGDGQLRELRPRAGRSLSRALPQRSGEVFVIAAVAPETQQDLRGFGRAVERAGQRRAEIDDE